VGFVGGFLVLVCVGFGFVKKEVRGKLGRRGVEKMFVERPKTEEETFKGYQLYNSSVFHSKKKVKT